MGVDRKRHSFQEKLVALLTTMDYEGQKLAELILYWVILSFGCVGWVIGYFQQDFTVVFQAWLAGVVLSVIVSKGLENYVDCIFFSYLTEEYVPMKLKDKKQWLD